MKKQFESALTVLMVTAAIIMACMRGRDQSPGDTPANLARADLTKRIKNLEDRLASLETATL